jgi:hypothetical protein
VVDANGSGSCPVAGFGIRGIESLGNGKVPMLNQAVHHEDVLGVEV